MSDKFNSTVNGRSPRRDIIRRWLTVGILWSITWYAVAPILHAQTGSIAPNAIEIDNNANHHPGDGNANIKNSGATIDWVRDLLPNTDVDPDPNDSVAIGVVPGETGAAAVGHWNGVRVIDKIASADQDIFLTGGKENDVSTWNVGPGSVGSSKYDISQAYIANNQTNLFFGMERRGHNGTTAFDFEFNQVGTAGGYIPNRTVGDILVTFEMQGSGGSGSATPFFFRWNGSTYAPFTPPPGVLSSINNVAVPPAPWGYVDSRGDWVNSPDIPRFEFAEAQVPLSILPNVNSCGGSAFVQVRTRASSTENSDLKDTTKIFRFVFAGPAAAGELAPDCDLRINYDGSSSRASDGRTFGQGAPLTFSWQFQRFTGTDPANDSHWTNEGSPVTGVTGTFIAASAGTYRARLTITEAGICTDARTTNSVFVLPALDGTPSLANDCDGNFTYSTTVSGGGGAGNYNFAWTFSKLNPGSGQYEALPALNSTTQSGSIASFVDGSYRATVTISNANGLACPIVRNAGPIEVRNRLTAGASKTAASTGGSPFADIGFTATVTATTNAGSDAVTYQWSRKSGASYVPLAGETNVNLIRSMANIFTDGIVGAETTSTLLNEVYKLRLATLTVKVRATRTLNGCEADSPDVAVKSIKAIDP